VIGELGIIDEIINNRVLVCQHMMEVKHTHLNHHFLHLVLRRVFLPIYHKLNETKERHQESF